MFLINFLTINRTRFTNLLVGAMFLSVAIDMGGDFGLRNIIFPICALLLMAINGLTFPRAWLFPFVVLVIYPTLSLFIGLSSDAKFSIAFSQYQSTMLAFLLYILVSRLPYQTTTTTLLNSLFFVALLAVGLAIGLVLGVSPVLKVLSLMAEKGGGYFGERGGTIEELIPNVYFKATLFFVPSFFIALFARKYLIAFVLFFALVAAVSKTGMVVAGLLSVAYLLRNSKRKEFFIGSFVLILVIVFVLRSPIYFYFEEMFQNKSITLDTRAGHFKSLITLWENNLLQLFFGFGLGTSFYSSGAGAVVSNIELDHLNIIRKYGLFWAGLFFVWVLSVSLKAIKNNSSDVRCLGWALLIAFVVAGTNPVMISPVFFLFMFLTVAANHQSGIRCSNEYNKSGRFTCDIQR